MNRSRLDMKTANARTATTAALELARLLVSKVRSREVSPKSG
jgi:hypothetical protein